MSNRCVYSSTLRWSTMLLRAFVLLVLFAVAGSHAAAQGVTSFGRRFIVAFPDTTQSKVRLLYDPLQANVTLTIYSFDTAHVSVRGPGFSRSVTVRPDVSQTIALTDPFTPAAKIFTDSVNTPQSTSFEILSDRPVAVTAFFATLHGIESFTPVPVEGWGREYFAATLNQWFVFNALQTEEINTIVIAPAALAIVASEDNTDVTIESPALLSGDSTMPTTRTITLNSGQVYQIETGTPRGPNIASPDLTGTHVTASKPIGVISGNTRTLGTTDTTQNTIPTDPLPTNSLTNACYEWLHPVSSHGHTFVYRQFSAVAESQSTELVRVYATSPGITIATITNIGAPESIPQGSYYDYPSRLFRRGTALEPFAVRTDKPAQVFVFTASHATPPDTNVSMETTTWSPAMAELVPRERWMTIGRFNTPLYPGGISHYVVVAADSGTNVLLDGQPIVFDSLNVIGTTFRHARVPVTLGDHTMRAIGGRFTATAYGQRRGYAAFRPFVANDDSEPPAGVMHPTYYLEILSAAYAMPVPGISDFVAPKDSVTISRLDKCDSSVVMFDRAGVTWSSGIINADVDAGSRNVDFAITKTFAGRIHLGYRIRFMPIDPARDASGSVTITNEAGQSWTIPFIYRAYTIALDPATIDLLAVATGITQTIPITLTNQKPFTTSVLDVHLRRGDQGFVVNGRGQLVKTLAAGGSFAMSIDFTGAVPGRLYTDTLVIISDCDSMLVPLNARTAPPDPAPVPLITGYDWGVRRVGSINDTLSFISNAGTLPFTIDRIELLDNTSNAFAIVAPNPATLVDPAQRTIVGVRFQPPSESSFASEILLITTDGDSARAELRGSSLLAAIIVPDIVPLDLCLGRGVDTSVTISASGSMATRIDSFIVTVTGGVRVVLDTAWMNLPRLIAPGDSLPLRMRLTGTASGAFDVAIVAVSAATGDSLAHVAGVVDTCVTPGIATTDHDFDSVLVTRLRTGTVRVINTGTGDINVSSMRIVDDAAGAFRVIAPDAPFIVAQGIGTDVDVAFSPPAIGPFFARVEYETNAGTVYSSLRGVGVQLHVPVFIPRDYSGVPGREYAIAVMLDTNVDVTGADSIAITVAYDSTLLDFVGLHDTVATQASLRMISAQQGTASFALQPLVDTLVRGPIAALRFLVRISPTDSSELPLAIASTIPWIVFDTSPGLFKRLPWCGLTQRMFEFTPGSLMLRPVRPTPVVGDAQIEFAIPFDGQTTLVVSDASGSESLRLVDEFLAEGAYTFMLPAGMLPSGAYFLQLNTSGTQRVVRFIVE